MAQGQRSVTFRLGTSGAAEVKNDFKAVGDAGEDAARRLGARFQRETATAEAAAKKAADTAAKLAAIVPQTPIQRQVQANASTNSGLGPGSARDSAAVFQELARAEAELEAKTRALLTVIDPVWAAQQRFNTAVAEAKRLLDAGKISVEQYAAAERLAKAALDETVVAHGRAGVSTGQLRVGTQQLSYQLGDVAQQFAAGTSPAIIFAQQIGQVTQAVGLMSNTSKGFVGFLGGPWGAAISAGLVLLSPFVAKLFETDDAAKAAEDGLRAFQDRQSDIGQFIDRTTGKLKEQNRTLIQNAILLRQSRIDENKKVISEKSINAFVAARQAAGDPTPIYTAGGVIKPRVDTAIDNVIRQAGNDVEKLDLGLQRLARQRPDLRDTIRRISDAAAETVGLARDNAELKREIAGLTGDTTAVREASTKAAETHTQVARAVRTSATAHVEARKALVDFASVARELEASYDPRGAALTRYREELVKIANAQAAGAIGADRAALYRQGALGEGLRAFPLVAPETDAQRRARDDAQARADFIAQQIEGQQSSIAIAQRELELVGTNDRYRSAEIDKLNLILDLKRRGIDPVSAEAQLLIGNLELLDATNEKVRLAQDRSRELRQLGENAIDRLFDVNSAEDWGDRVLGILGDIGEEFLRLALINPLKNELFGSGLSTLGGGGGLGFLGDIFGGLLSIFGLASGTEYARGGMALVGEHGPETVMMPRGARVLTAPETRRRLGGESKGDGPPPIYLTLNANFAGGAATKQDVEDMGQAAATAAYQAVIEREKRRP